VLVIGLTGGIGSGKSTVSALLAAKGAVVVDADAITRELQEPGTPTFAAMVERFGDGTFVEEGEITYGSAGKVTFTTQGRGWVAPAPTPGAVYGAVVWTVTGGGGRFTGARGLITSNFAVSPTGDVVDHHVARLLLP